MDKSENIAVQSGQEEATWPHKPENAQFKSDMSSLPAPSTESSPSIPEPTAASSAIDYPPLTPLSGYPLHNWDYGDENPYACERPEDPTCTQFDWRCPACLLAAQAQLINKGDYSTAWRRYDISPAVEVKLSWLIARSIYWLYDAAAN